MKLSEAQRRALSAYADGGWRSAGDAAKSIGIAWPASGNFGRTVRELMLRGLLDFRHSTGEYRLNDAGRAALRDDGDA